jgi:HD-GYP domain-containing protein (c-di-GMP phosphodiesterase class II)
MPRVTAAQSVADELVREARTRYEADRLERRARLAFLFSGGAVVVGAIACATAFAHSAPGLWWKAPLFVAVYALATRADFEIASGSAVPTEIVLVPLLFALPIGLAPTLVAVAFVLGTVVAERGGLGDPARVLPLLGSSAHVFGPVLVLALANGLPLRWSAWPIYLGALAAQFAFDFAAAAIGNLGHGIGPSTLARFIGFPWSVDAALAPLGLALAFVIVDRAYLIVLVLPLIALLRVFAHERRRRLDHALELSAAYRGTAFLLGDVIEAEDAYTGAHSRHVVDLVRSVCDKLNLSAGERRDAELTALLHDVGKIRIPQDVLHKPGALDAQERLLVETHPVEGERMLNQVGGLLAQVGHIVRSCHERWDGDGYPDQLAGERIPLVARIVCVCDAYSAMTTDRPYRSALTDAEARAEIARCAGTQFDPHVAGALLSVVG